MMSSEEIEKVCRAADMIVCGYAFTRVADGNTPKSLYLVGGRKVMVK